MKLIRNFIISSFLLCMCITYAKAQSYEPNMLLRGMIEEDDAIGFFHYSNAYWVSSWDLSETGNALGKLNIYRNDGDRLVWLTSTILNNMPTDVINGGSQNYLGFTTDGTYVYAVNYSRNIFVIDPSQYSVIDYITTNPETGFTAIAYDYEKGGFWCTDSDGNYVWFVNKNGEVDFTKELGTEYNRIVGLAYDDISEGGPYLWTSITGVTYQQNLARIGRFQINTGDYESFVYDAKDCIGWAPTYGSYMGGIYTYPDYALGKFVLAGIYSSEGGLFAVDLGDISPKGTPRGVKNLVLSTKKENGLNIELSWTNPVETVDHMNLTSLTSVNIYRNDVLVHTINNPVPAASLSWTDTGVASEGVVNYIVTVSNNIGEGLKVNKTVYAGEDVPGAPAGVNLRKDNSTSATITWSAPLESKYGGWFDEASLTYKVVRLPDNVVIVENTTAKTATDNTIVDMGLYSYTVTASSRKGEGLSATSDAMLFGDSMTVPWYEPFENAEHIYSLWTVIDINDDGYRWLHNPYSSMGGSMQCSAFSVDRCDDWLISPALILEKDKEYRLRFHLTITTETNKALEVKMGKSATTEGQTILLKEYTGNVDSYAQQDIIFSVTESGEYNFGWHAMVGGEVPHVYLSNVSIEEVPSIDMAVLSIDSENEMVIGTEYTMNVKVKNEGKSAASGFKVNLTYTTDNQGTVHVNASPYTYTGSLAAGEEAIIPFKFTPALEKTHTFQASVVLEGDIKEDNNATSPYPVTVYPEGTEKKFIGDSNTSNASQLAPFNFYYIHGAAQSLYSKSQLGGEGTINEIEYYYSFEPGDAVENKSAKIYMAHTGWNDMYEGWVVADTLLAFEGTLDFVLGGRQKITIKLDRPFVYNGKDNLVVFTVNSNDKSSNPLNQFIVTSTNSYSVRVNANNAEPFSFDQVGRITNIIPNTTFTINRLGGKLSGTVKDNNGQPMEGVVVGAEDQSWTAVTDAQGKYEFPFFPAKRSYTVIAAKPGYVQSQKPAVTLADKESKTLDITMNALQTTSITGFVNDKVSDIVVHGANVILRGDVEYQVLTDNSGKYSFEDIYCSSYTMYVYKEGYQYYTGEITIKSGDTTIPAVELQSCQSNVPTGFDVVTNSYDWYNMVFTWSQPDGVTSQHYVTGYNLYVDDMLVKTVASTARKAYYNIGTSGAYTCKLSAIWNDGCESDRLSKLITISEDLWDTTIIADFPWEEDFETGVKEGYWKDSYLNASRTPWEVVRWVSTATDLIYPHGGTYCISLRNRNTATNVTRLISPQLDLSNQGQPKLKFWRNQPRALLNSDYDEIAIMYKNAPDAQWQEIAFYGNPTTDWVEATLDLPNPSETYWIAFDGITFFGYGAMIDDIIVFDDSSCGEVLNLRNTQLTGTQDVKLEWDAPATKGVLSYTVMRNDVLIAENIAAHEYTDISVPAGQYEYAVIAKYNKTNCTESEPAKLSVTVTPLSIDAITLERLVVKPNPAKTVVKFNGENIVSVHIYNALGGLIDAIETDPRQTEHTLSVASYAAGTYLFRFTTGKGETAIRKVVVKP